MSGSFDLMDWLSGLGQAGGEIEGAEAGAGAGTAAAPITDNPLVKGAAVGGAVAGAKAGVESVTATGSTPPTKPASVPGVPGVPGTSPSGTPYEPGSATGPYAQGKAPSSTPDVGMGKPSASSQFGKAGDAFKEGFRKLKVVSDDPTARKVGLYGAGLLASKALAGDTSAGAAPKPPSGYDAGASAAAAAERERKRQAGAGRASTILTSPLGISRPASVGAKVLLGA